MWSSGDREAFQALIPLLYDELHQVAPRYLRKARPGHTLNYGAGTRGVSAVRGAHKARFQNHAHFIAICGLPVRLILIGHERNRRAAKREAGSENLKLDDAHAVMR